MKKLIAILTLTTIFFCASGQTPRQADSINRRIDSIQNLINTKMFITAAIIDSTVDRIKSTITAKDYDQWKGAYQFFINQLVATWLIKYGELDPKKRN